MPNVVAGNKVDAFIDKVQQAAKEGRITPDAAKNISAWLSEPRYAEYAPIVAEHVTRGQWKELDDAFWTVIPFGTGGRRGRMYGIGSNTINDRTIGESAQGLADYVREQNAGKKNLACAIAYDTRHQSRHFAELCSGVMVANGFKVYFLDGFRSTPELSFCVREKQCDCGLMVTASHNPPSDNAVKAYWSTGGQLLPPHDRGVIERVMNTDAIKRTPFAEALSAGKVEMCQEEIDQKYIDHVAAQSLPGPRDIKILYSPMHGVGTSSVVPVLRKAGFTDVVVFGPHAEPNGDFPNVPEHVSNPENPATFDAMIAQARQEGKDLILSTDPDADRLGAAAPKKFGGDEWGTFTGNQIGALLTDYLLSGRKAARTLSPDQYIVKTLVTTEMARRIADSYGVQTVGDLQVGFKWIGGAMDEKGPANFILGTEESHGYLVGTYARDKDAAVAALLLAELAAKAKADKQTLHERLDALFWQFGCHAERTISKTMPGSEGMAQMRAAMAALRKRTPSEIAGMKVARARDYQNLETSTPDGKRAPLDGPKGDMVIIDLEQEGNYVAVRPSGTEPKIKFYLFTYEPAELIADLDSTRQELEERLNKLGKGLFELVEQAVKQ